MDALNLRPIRVGCCGRICFYGVWGLLSCQSVDIHISDACYVGSRYQVAISDGTLVREF